MIKEVELLSCLDSMTVDTGYPEFPKACRISEESAYIVPIPETFWQDGDLILYSVVVRAEKRCTPMELTVCGKSSTSFVGYIPVQWTRVYLPVRADAPSALEIRGGNFLLAEAKAENHASAEFEELALRNGQHILEPWEYIPLRESCTGVGPTMDFVKNGDFLYAIGAGEFRVVDITNPDKPRVRGKICGLGNSIRQIDLCRSGCDVIVSSRQDGVFIIHVQDPDKPYIRSVYDSVEMATGVAVYGDYAFICNRSYGVEIADISDLDHPRHVSNIRCGEAQSCRVKDGILYNGLWNQCRVDMFDVRNPNAPCFLGSALLNGKGDGLCVADFDGRTYLYAATGQHVRRKDPDTPLSDLEYGQGNGLDIFDVTDPSHPVWLSTSRIDGRYYYPENDFWEAEVAEDASGNRYAYLLNSYNGVFIYNVNDPAAPRRIAKVDIPILPGEKNYQLLTHDRAIVFPYDQEKAVRDPVAAICVENGRLYLAGASTDIHMVKKDKLFFAPKAKGESVPLRNTENSFYRMDGRFLPDFCCYVPGGQVYAVVPFGGNVYAACGVAGIHVLDRELRVCKAVLQTAGTAMDVQVFEDTLYVAEGRAGLAAYRIVGDAFLPLWRYQSARGPVRQVRLSPKARFALVQVGGNKVEQLRLADQSVLDTHVSPVGLMYHHYLTDLIGGRYIGCRGNQGLEYWDDFGAEDDYEAPLLLRRYPRSRITMSGGATGYGNKVLATGRGSGKASYFLYDPADPDSNPFSGLGMGQAIKPSGVPRILGNTLVLCNRVSGEITIADISDLENPVLLERFIIAGNPDIPVLTEDTVFIPAGNQGLLKFGMKPYLR